LNWLVEHCIRNEGFWVAASLLSTCLFLFDERSWHGLAKSGYKFELQHYRTRIALLAISSAGLSSAAPLVPGVISRLVITALSLLVLHVFQRNAYDFGGINISGASKRIILGLSLVLVAFAMLPIVPTTFIPLIFVTAGAVSSLSSRNHLFFKLSEESTALRQRLFSEQAARHNHNLLVPTTSYAQSSDDIAPKAG
jgi:hypothetical protein